MSAGFAIREATAGDAPDAARMVGELLAEIMGAIDVQAFNFDLEQTIARLEDFLLQQKYFVFIAHTKEGQPAGLITLYESHALYAEGAFGTIAELYVRPAYRARQLGRQLLTQARILGARRGWSRLEVTTPPLPQFERTLAFYEREGFAVSGGRKLKQAL